MALQHSELSNLMAIYHLSVKPISRRSGRSATAAAAYRAGSLGLPIRDLRTGIVHDYSRKKGVDYVCTVFPDGEPKWANTREKLWNAAELAERRKDACTAREIEVAIPVELDREFRRVLVVQFAIEIAKAEGCAVDLAVHFPPRGGDGRNTHAHLLRTTRQIMPDGMGAKLATERAGRSRINDLKSLRKLWADLVNLALAESRLCLTVDHRSLRAQGILHRKPTFHLGRAATTIDRRRHFSDPDPVTTVGKRLANLILENSVADAKWRFVEAQVKLAAESLKAAEREIRNAIRRRTFDRIRGYGEKVDANVRSAKQHAELFKRNSGRVAEACSVFRIARRDSQFAQGIGGQIGSVTKGRLVGLTRNAKVLSLKLRQALLSGRGSRVRKRNGN